MKSIDDIDFSSLPILRIDQIPRIDTHILIQVNIDASALLRSIIDEQCASCEKSSIPRPSLALYIEKQIQLTNAELSRRAAADRIDDMLNSVSERSASDKPRESFRSASAPLLEARSSRAGNIAVAKTQNNNTSDNSRASRDFVQSQSSSTKHAARKEVSLSNEPESKPSRRKADGALGYANHPRSDNALLEFVVAATEKKVRFYPKKVSVVSVEEAKEKDRTER